MTEDDNPVAILGVSADRWSAFQRAMETSKVHVITKSGGYGAFDIRPRRLVELGYAKGLRRAMNGKREIWRCDFRPPWTERKFLSSPLAQVAAFRASMRDYANQIARGKIIFPQKWPQECSLAGALAVLHVGGKGALGKFPDLFSETKRRYDAVKGIF